MDTALIEGVEESQVIQKSEIYLKIDNDSTVVES